MTNTKTSERRLAERFILNTQPIDVVDVYSGKNGKCCCGCSGAYSYSSANAKLGTERRGYDVDDDDINDAQVTRVLNIIKEHIDDVVIGENNWSVVIGARLYIVYPVVKL